MKTVTGVVSWVLAALLVVASGAMTTSAAAASQRAAAGTAPRIGAVTISHQHLSGHGGKIAIKARLARARICKLSVKPALKTHPVTKSCPGQTVEWKPTLPASQSVKDTTYHFTISAYGAGHRKVVKKRTVVVGPTTRAPSISHFKQSLRQLTSEGGVETVTATTPRSGRCQLTVSPPILGLPQTKSCTSGKVSWTPTVPPNPIGTVVTYTFSVKATGTHHRSVVKALPPVTVAGQTTTCPGQTSTGVPTSGALFNDPSTGNAVDADVIVNAELNDICSVSPPANGKPAEIDLAMYIYQLPVISDALMWAHEYRGADVHVILDGHNTYRMATGGTTVSNPAYDVLSTGENGLSGLPDGSVILCGAQAGISPPPPGDGTDPPVWAPNETGCAGDDIMHTKMLTVSSVDTLGDPLVLTGSQNLDPNSEAAAFCDAITIVGNQPLYQTNVGYLNHLVADEHQTDPDLGDQLGAPTTSTTVGAVTSLFFPRNSPPTAFPTDNHYHAANDTATDPTPKLLSQVGCATYPGNYAGDHAGTTAHTLVEVGMYDFSNRAQITDELEAMAKAGCEVKIVYDDMSDAVESELAAAGVQLEVLDDASWPYTNGSGAGHIFIHSKFLLISGAVKPVGSTVAAPNQQIVQAGSMNYAESGIHLNDEQDLTVQQTASSAGGTPVFEGYQQDWTHLWQVAALAAPPTPAQRAAEAAPGPADR